MKFYHGTTTSALQGILEDGIKPQASFDNPNRTAIYLSDDEHIADMYAVLACDRRGGKVVVIEIDADKLTRPALEPDDYDLQDLIDDYHDPDRVGPVGLNTGLDMDDRLADFQRWESVPALLSLELSKQVAYIEPIGVDAFLNLEELHRILRRETNTPALSQARR